MIVALLFIFILLQIADSLTTVHILKNGGSEINPLMNNLFQKFGMIPSLIVMKLIVIGLLAWAWDIYAMSVACIIYFGVVGWNSYEIYKTK